MIDSLFDNKHNENIDECIKELKEDIESNTKEIESIKEQISKLFTKSNNINETKDLSFEKDVIEASKLLYRIKYGYDDNFIYKTFNDLIPTIAIDNDHKERLFPKDITICNFELLGHINSNDNNVYYLLSSTDFGDYSWKDACEKSWTIFINGKKISNVQIPTLNQLNNLIDRKNNSEAFWTSTLYNYLDAYIVLFSSGNSYYYTHGKKTEFHKVYPYIEFMVS